MKRGIKREKKISLAELSNLQKQYMDEYKEQQKYFDKELLEITSLPELERFQKRATKALQVLKNKYEEIQNYVAAPSTNPKQLLPKKTQIEFKKAVPDIKALHEKINERKQEIKTKRDPAKLLKQLKENYRADTFDIKAYNDFLTNPIVKNKVKYNPIFAARVDKLNKKVITRYAHTIAALDQELFLKISTKELFSPPWKPHECPSMAAFTDQNVNLTNYVSSLVLDAESMEQRTLIVERWVWVAYSLYHEHKDLSACQAIITGLSSTEVERLKRTFEGMSLETEEVFDTLKQTMLPLRPPPALNPIMSEKQAVIPSMALIRRDLTYLEDGNHYLEEIESKDERRLEMATRIASGVKMRITIDKLQKERASLLILEDKDTQLDTIFRDMLKNGYAYDQDAYFEKSETLEPIGNDLAPAKSVKFGRVFKPSSSHSSNEPTMQQQIFKELIQDIIPSALNKITFAMDQDYIIDEEKEDSQLEPVKREIEAYIENLTWFLKDEKNSSLVKEGTALLQTLKELDLHQLKTQNLEAQLFVALYKLKIEFGTLSRLNPTSDLIQAIEAEVAKINDLTETYEFSRGFRSSLSAFNVEISTFRQLANKAEGKQEGQENKEASVPDWRSNRSGQDQTSRNRYSLLYSQDIDAGKEGSVSELAEDKKVSSVEQRNKTLQKRYSVLYSQLSSQIIRDTGKDKEPNPEPLFAHCP
ncbi:RasGEF domain protein [Legionella nautarum]|uniref:RasGEF domain protein n=1 Tax=Legionella nautarum TaxID=45070 RepID=A0A0W0WWM9_9GAMM|nr:RasGEF domain-containing protein [Legionella nautarum]KTD36722.1 RasGEF domain protein [Legionella nautarum]